MKRTGLDVSEAFDGMKMNKKRHHLFQKSDFKYTFSREIIISTSLPTRSLFRAKECFNYAGQIEQHFSL